MQRRKTPTTIAITALAAVVMTMTAASPAHADPERRAAGSDSDSLRWSWIHTSRYGDIIRKTDRVTYTDAGAFTPIGCDATADGLPDIVFANGEGLHVLGYIPYGDPADEVTRTLAEQNELVTIPRPEGSQGFGKLVTCLPGSAKGSAMIGVSDETRVYLYAPDAQGALKLSTTIETGREIKALAGGPRSALRSSIAIGAADGVSIIKTETLEGRPQISLEEASAEKWPIDGSQGLSIIALETVRGHYAVGSPASRTVFVASAATKSAQFTEKAIRIEDKAEAADTAFGASLAAIADLDGDGTPNLAIGAPGANGGRGAVALVTTPDSGSITVTTSSQDSSPVVNELGGDAGFLLLRGSAGRLGASLAWIDGGTEAGALLVGHPQDPEHTGGVIISQKALNRNYNTGQGITDIPSGQMATIASAEGGEGDAGSRVGIIPRRGDDPLVGLYTADSTNRVDVWTVDMSRQSEPTHDENEPIVAPIPEPPAPTAEAVLSPLDTDAKKIWLGEFTSGLGSSLARGRCDVTGDGKADIVSGNVVRSEWKWDPFYAESTPTKGWVFNVTGQIQIIPGGTPGKELPSEETISINGPKRTPDPAVDSAIGLSVACLGDVNGDRIDDIAFGSHTTAKVWVLFGGEHLREVDLNALKPEYGWAVDLPEKGSGGFQISRVGDVDNDGLADLGFVVANAAYASGTGASERGTAYILKGKKDGATIDLKNLEAPNEAVIKKIHTPEGHTMNAFTPVGDINADGVEDFVVADFQHRNDEWVMPGMAWVVYGDSSPEVRAGQAGRGFVLSMPFDRSHRLGAGNSIAPLGDADGDGVGDFLIGFDGGQLLHQGSGGVALVLGRKTPVGTPVADLVISPLDAAAQSDRVRVITGRAGEEGIGFGYAVDALERAEQPPLIALGAWGENTNGRARLFSADQFTAPVRSIDEVEAEIIESAGERARFGRSIAFIGDLLGAPSLAIGADGVIDDEAKDEQGYAHSAHIMALRVSEPPSEDGSGADGKHGKQQKNDGGASSAGSEKALARTGFDARIGLAALVLLLAGAALHGRRSARPE